MSKKITIATAASVTFIGGLLNLVAVMGPLLPERARRLTEVAPPELLQLSRLVTLLTGLALIVLSVNIYKRKKRAFQLAAALAGLSILLHLGTSVDYAKASAAAVLLTLLWLSRREFVVESSIPNPRWAALRFGAATVATFFYGIAGFWLLDAREFGVNFHLGDAIHRTTNELLFLGNQDLVPRTHHAEWFLHSLDVIMVAALAYGLFALFRPAIYRFRTRPMEQQLAEQIVREHGNCGLDYFKFSPENSFFFTQTRESFVAYRVGRGFALALGDPVGPRSEKKAIIREFTRFCERNDWLPAFYQTLPDLSPLYKEFGFRRLKIGDEAIVDLTEFRLEGRKSKHLRSNLTQMEKRGVRFERYAAPVADEMLNSAEHVSEKWLTIPGRRERTFTLGRFEREAIRQTPVAAALDADGKMFAFMNEIPSFTDGEATVDLMRHLPDALNGAMDFVFTRLMLAKKAEGYKRFNLGMAPMAGFQENENAGVEERAVHVFMQRLSFLFSFQGLRRYKAKFATSWEPRYLIYRNILNLPRLARAIADVSEIHDD